MNGYFGVVEKYCQALPACCLVKWPLKTGHELAN